MYDIINVLDNRTINKGVVLSLNTNSTNKLIEILELKQIKFDKGEKALFRKYSYYQVVNAYKNLFVQDIEYIDTIRDNILQNKNIDFYRSIFKIKPDIKTEQLYEKICDKICEKYGLKSNSLKEKEENIKQIQYHLHKYNSTTKYGDFVRMYKFEHELRLMLLKYTLIIEESMKNIFISYLNDNNAKADYLVNMHNYNTSSIRNKAFDTMKLIIGKYDNTKSKPIKRKREQNLTVPYWIIINELAMNQTYYAIANLREEDSRNIFINCTNFFTNLNITKDKKGKSDKIKEKEESQINTFKTILCYLGEFRNMLAHNQPIYCYNIDSFDITKRYPFEYELPKVNKNKKSAAGNPIPKYKQQINLNAKLMQNLSDYFGEDNFNRNNYTNLNLSKIIYIIYKILKNIDRNTNFYNELKSIFVKYNVLLNEKHIEIENPEAYIDLLNEIKKLDDFSFDSKDIISKIESKKAYKKIFNDKNSKFNAIKNLIIKKSNRIKISTIESKYKPFLESKRYTQFTGIDEKFFTKIL